LPKTIVVLKKKTTKENENTRACDKKKIRIKYFPWPNLSTVSDEAQGKGGGQSETTWGGSETGKAEGGEEGMLKGVECP